VNLLIPFFKSALVTVSCLFGFFAMKSGLGRELRLKTPDTYMSRRLKLLRCAPSSKLTTGGLDLEPNRADEANPVFLGLHTHANPGGNWFDEGI
jgi:hypothetical protein